MKKVLSLVLVAVMVLSLAACGSKAPTTPADVKGETYNAGNISGLVPEGWMLVEGIDYSGETSTTDKNSFYIYKGAESQWDVFTKCWASVNYYESSMYIIKDWYDDVEDLGEMTIGNYTWKAFKYKSLDYPYVTLYTGIDDESNPTGGGQIQVNILLQNDKETIALEDADVQAFIMSIKH